jgi:hypothetical protein
VLDRRVVESVGGDQHALVSGEACVATPACLLAMLPPAPAAHWLVRSHQPPTW